MPRIAVKPLLLAVAIAFAAQVPAHAADDAATRVKALNALLAEQWEYTLKHSPEFATILGDYRYNDQWSNASLAATQQQKKDNEAFLKRFQAIDTTGFDEQDKLNQQLMVRQLGDNIRNTDLKLYEMPLDQFNGVHLQLAQFVSLMPFDTAKQYDEYLARLNKLPALFDQLTDVLKQGEKDKLLPPRFLLEKVVTQIRAIAKPAGEESVFGRPVAKFPDGVAEAERKRLHDAIIKAVDEKVRPAYTKLADFVEKDYAPKGRTEPGMWALPNGDELYKFSVEQQTTTNKSPQEIHDLGLSEVKRIEGEQLKIAQKLGYKDLKSFREAMDKDPKTHATSREQIVDLYKKYIAQRNRSCRSCSACCRRPRSKCCPCRNIARRKLRAPSTTKARRTASVRAKSTSTRATTRIARCFRSNRRRITKRFPATTCRSRSRRPCRACRRSASRPATRPTSKAGRCMRNALARKSVSIRIR